MGVAMDVQQSTERQRWSIQAAVASQIISYIRAQELVPGSHISELRLSDALGVSRSPIRSALQMLFDKGVLTREPNRGYFLAVDPDGLAEAVADLPKSDEEELYRRIVTERLEKRLPDHVTEADLVRSFGASRALLVRVLSRMAEDGVIQRARGHGWRFQPALLTEDAHDESYRFRLLLEPAGLREPTFAVDPERLALLRRQHERLLANADTAESTDLFQVNADFHETIAGFSNNRYILQAVQNQNRLRRLIEVKGLRDAERIRQSCTEHLEVITALEAGDRDLAAVLMTRHLTVASRLKLAFTPPSTH